MLDATTFRRTPVLYFGHAEGCETCGKLTPTVYELKSMLRGKVTVEMADVTQGQFFPADVDSVPVFALTVPGVPGVWMLKQKDTKRLIDLTMLRTWIADGLTQFKGKATRA